MSIWYDWSDGGDEKFGLVSNSFDPEKKMYPWTPKLAYNATKTLSNALKGVQFVGRIPTFQDGFNSDDEYLLKFENTTMGKIVLAMRSLAGYPHLTRIPGGIGCYAVHDYLGRALPRLCEDLRGIHINISQAPQFLTSDGM